MSTSSPSPASVAPHSAAGGATPRSLGYHVWRRLRRNHSAMLGGIVLLFLIGTAIFGYFYAGDLYDVGSTDARFAPGPKHWLGTDDLGRDIFHRLLFGAHLTLGTGFCIVLLATLIGAPLGLFSAYLGKRTDAAIMRVLDIILAFPSILLAMAILAALGFNLRNIVIAIALVYIPKFARVARSVALVERSLDYVKAAEAMGCSKWRIIFRHLAPNCMAPVLVLGTLSLATAILEAAALSYLGLGAQPPLSEWGRMLNDGRAGFQTHPHMMMVPGIAIAITVLAVNLLGDGLRDALDVRVGK